MRGLAVIAAVLALAAPASASTVSVSTSTFFATLEVQYDAAAGEVNDVTVSGAVDGVHVVDPGATISAGAGCTSLAPSHAVCDATGVGGIDVITSDGDARVVVEESAYALVPRSRVTTGDGDDAVTTGAGPDIILVDEGDDVVHAGAGNDSVQSGTFDENTGTAAGPDGADRLFGEDGNDLVFAGAGDDLVDGGPGSDDLLVGDTGADRVFGGDGDEGLIDGGSGNDLLDGGPGRDNVNGRAGDDLVRGGAGNDRLEGFDDEFGIDSSFFSAGNDTLEGGEGDDLLFAGPGDELGPERFDGGPGFDTVNYARRRSPLVVTLDELANDGAPGEGDLVGPSVERVLGGSDADSLTGGAGNETLDGGPGDDLLDGGAGDDTLEGGVNDGGSDGLTGGPGADLLRGGAGDDSLDGGGDGDDLAGGGGSDTLEGGDGFDQLAGGPGLDSVSGGEGDDVLRGGDVVLVGADGADALDGGPGADELLAGPGNDTLDGGPGPDRLSGEAGRDTVTYEVRNADIQVTLDAVADDGEAGEGDRVGADVEAVVGGAVADTLAGDGGANTLDGSSGEDYVDGAAGRDSLRGGSARDTVRSRDGIPDVVSCGDDVDFAIVDSFDTARDCERVERGIRRRAALGIDAAVRPERGRLAMRLPQTGRDVPLRDDVHVPLATTVDATAGRVRLTSARDRSGRPQAMSFHDGRFSVRQRGRRRPVTELALRGGTFRGCTPGMARVAAAQPVRRLWGRRSRRRGRFRVVGRWSTGTVRGTVFLTEDRCDGTLTRVRSGSVTVRDRVRKRTVVVRAGHSYLARAPSR